MLGRNRMFLGDRLPRKGRIALGTAGAVSVAVLAFLVALLATFSMGCGSDDEAATGGTGTSSSVAAAGFSGVTLDGTEVSLSDYRGKPLVLVFMATW